MCTPKVKYRLLIIDLVQLKIKELRLPFKTTRINFQGLFGSSTKITLHTVGQHLYITNWLPYHVLQIPSLMQKHVHHVELGLQVHVAS